MIPLGLELSLVLLHPGNYNLVSACRGVAGCLLLLLALGEGCAGKSLCVRHLLCK